MGTCTGPVPCLPTEQIKQGWNRNVLVSHSYLRWVCSTNISAPFSSSRSSVGAQGSLLWCRMTGTVQEQQKFQLPVPPLGLGLFQAPFSTSFFCPWAAAVAFYVLLLWFFSICAQYSEVLSTSAVTRFGTGDPQAKGSLALVFVLGKEHKGLLYLDKLHVETKQGTLSYQCTAPVISFELKSLLG